MQRSIWSETVRLPARPPLPGDRRADAVVIGGGLAGVLIAHFLRAAGLDTVVLEAGRTGGGQTRNTTAKITSQHGLIYHRLIEQLGEHRARLYADANQHAIGAYRTLIDAQQIDCDWTECPAWLYATNQAGTLVREWEAARALGIDAHCCAETELPFPVAAALRFEGQARFHPLKFLAAVSAPLETYEQTRVQAVKGCRVETDRGIVTAGHIVFACHYPFLNIPGYYFMRMHQARSYVLALENAAPPRGMYLGVDGDGLSLRPQGALLLLGGGSHRTGENSTGGQYEKLRAAAKRYWPDAREIAHWSAQDCMTLDGLPYIGRFSPAEPHWYVATGFQKWGMSSSMVAALLLTDLICRRENPWAALFSPRRFITPSANTKKLMQETAQAVKGLTRRFFVPPKALMDALLPGHGGIVDCGGEKLGVYRDEAGQAYVVAARCPHLGCQLEWNPDEKSWDCPCHGSRFDYRGERIDGPAQEDLTHG